jgi:hypothetical protein
LFPGQHLVESLNKKRYFSLRPGTFRFLFLLRCCSGRRRITRRLESISLRVFDLKKLLAVLVIQLLAFIFIPLQCVSKRS